MITLAPLSAPVYNPELARHDSQGVQSLVVSEIRDPPAELLIVDQSQRLQLRQTIERLG